MAHIIGRTAALAGMLAAGAVLYGCASKLTPTHSEVTAQVPLAATADPNVFAWKAPDLDVSRYQLFLIDPVTVYAGSDANFGGASPQEQQALANRVGSEFARVLSAHYGITTAPGRGVVRLRITLIGINQSRPVLSTALRLTPFGLAMTAVRGASDKPAMFTGSVTLAGAAIDTDTGKPIGGIEALVAPPAYDFTSGLGVQRAAELGVTRAAEQFGSYVDSLTGKR